MRTLPIKLLRWGIAIEGRFGDVDGKRTEQLIYLCREFVRIPSPSGNEERMARSVKASARVLGYDQVDVDHYGNVLMRMRFSGEGPRLLFHAQMDHVPPGDSTQWSFYPYGAVVSRKRIYGSGTMDQKGNLAAMMLAGAFLKEDFQRQDLRGELVVAAAVQQECFDVLAARSIASETRPDAVVLGDASNLEVVRGQPGRAKIALQTEGRMAHALSPAYGVNAAEKMLEVLEVIRKKYVPPRDVFVGEGALSLTEMSTSPDSQEKVIPTRCSATLVKRMVVGEGRDDCLEQIEGILAPLRKKDATLNLSVSLATTEGRCYTGVVLASEQFVPSWVLPVDHSFLSGVREWLRLGGLEGSLSSGPGFGTSGALYGGERRIPTLIFGAGRPELAHRVDEYIDIEQMRQACAGYRSIASGFLSASGWTGAV